MNTKHNRIGYRWIIKGGKVEKGENLLEGILRARNIEDIERFINPDYEFLHDPFALKGVETAALRIKKAIEKREIVFIHGDYDVDGVTSLALLYRNLKSLGAYKVVPYIPDRFDEGYGVSKKGIEIALKNGASLVITVDCGIKSHKEVGYALEKGLDVIVTDHHEPDTVPLPFPAIVVNPKIGGYPFKYLAGVGVTFKLLQALYRVMNRDEIPLKWDLDLVAIGTVSDVVPLTDENRIFVALGLKVLNKTKKAGLKALKYVSGIKDEILPWHISFILGPRLNAAGRLSHAKKAFHLLITKEGQMALSLANYLNSENKRRQKIEEEIKKEAFYEIEKNGYFKDYAIVVAKEGWHEGVIGIVASRIVEEYWRPAIVISIKGGIGKGSARSIPGFHIYHALKENENLLIAFGGHEFAAGIRIEEGKIELLREKLNQYAESILEPEDLMPALYIDAEVEISHLKSIDLDFYKRLGPFGIENPVPLFLLRGVEVVGSIKRIGEHLGFRVKKGKDHLKVFAPGFGWLNEFFKEGKRRVDMVVTIEEDKFSVKRSVKLKVKDLRIIPENTPSFTSLPSAG